MKNLKILAARKHGAALQLQTVYGWFTLYTTDSHKSYRHFKLCHSQIDKLINRPHQRIIQSHINCLVGKSIRAKVIHTISAWGQHLVTVQFA